MPRPEDPGDGLSRRARGRMRNRPLAPLILRRVLALVVQLLVVSFAVFGLLAIAPGEPERLLLGTRQATPGTMEAIRQEYRLDEPLLTQYGAWLGAAARLDLGTSIRNREPVLSGVLDRLYVTAGVGLMGFVIAMAVGVPLGIVAALRRGTIVDRAAVGLSIVGISSPSYAVGIVLLYVFAVALPWFPAFGEGQGFFGHVYHLTLPAIALAIGVTALVVKFTRAGMLRALEQDYVAFARSRGIRPLRVTFSYAFRNALVPVVTAGGLILSAVLVGSVFVEAAFSLNGVGALFVRSVELKDIPMVQGIALLTATIVVLVNFLTDVAYLLVDPRIRFGKVEL
jgi:peptide/nickel transport system permease protein